MKKINIYLDDFRVPVSPMKNGETWELYKNYNDLIKRLEQLKFEEINIISLDHDLGPNAMTHFFNHTSKYNEILYHEIHKHGEMTGYDVALYLVNRSKQFNEKLPIIMVHSANPIGSSNIMGLINMHLYNNRLIQNCIRWYVEIIKFKENNKI